MPQEERKRRLKSRLGLTLCILAFELVFVKSSKTCFRVFSIFRNFRMQDSSGEVLQQAAFDGVQQNSLEDHFRVIVNDVNSRAAKSWVSRYHGPMGENSPGGFGWLPRHHPSGRVGSRKNLQEGLRASHLRYQVGFDPPIFCCCLVPDQLHG